MSKPKAEQIGGYRMTPRRGFWWVTRQSAGGIKNEVVAICDTRESALLAIEESKAERKLTKRNGTQHVLPAWEHDERQQDNLPRGSASRRTLAGDGVVFVFMDRGNRKAGAP